MPEAAPRAPWRVLLGQFRSILILILIGAACLAALVGSLKDALVILAVIVINALVGFYQEYRAERSLDALKSMLANKARVRRGGSVHEISTDVVVPGDVLLLEAGDRVSAAGRLAVIAGVEIDESALAGESQPAEKDAALLAAIDAPIGDRHNMVYMNTLVTHGRAEVVVTATGLETELGPLSRELAATDVAATPLQIQLDRLGKCLGVVALSLVGLLSFLQFLRGAGLAHIVLDTIALTVAAMPEGPPVVVTVTLALGMHKMAHQHAMVRRLASVETLGCTTVICSDNTSTLTLNQMTARTFLHEGRRFETSGGGCRAQGTITEAAGDSEWVELARLLVPMVACNDSRVDDGKVIGDAMEAALLVLAAKGGMV